MGSITEVKQNCGPFGKNIIMEFTRGYLGMHKITVLSNTTQLSLASCTNDEPCIQFVSKQSL
jgi:hypothetical protein